MSRVADAGGGPTTTVGASSADLDAAAAVFKTQAGIVETNLGIIRAAPASPVASSAQCGLAIADVAAGLKQALLAASTWLEHDQKVLSQRAAAFRRANGGH